MDLLNMKTKKQVDLSNQNVGLFKKGDSGNTMMLLG